MNYIIRRSRFQEEGKTLLGSGELLRSLENKKCMARPVLVPSGKNYSCFRRKYEFFEAIFRLTNFPWVCMLLGCFR